jgi:cytochrome c peroxidase
MKKRNLSRTLLALAAAATITPCLADNDGNDRDSSKAIQQAQDATGTLGIFNANGRTRTDGPFFQSLGTNGRSCATCHVAEQAFSFSAAGARERFEHTHGHDPLFAAVDGANCPSARSGDSAGHSLIVQNGLIRVGIQLPVKTEFTITAVHDPYGCAIIPGDAGAPPTVSVYRRPLPTTNLVFLSTVMFDGRETLSPLNNEQTFFANLVADLTHQAMDATLGHAQAAQSPSASQLSQIVDFELGFYTAQLRDEHAGHLTAHGAQGGPLNLANEQYYPGINDTLGADPDGNPFNPNAMTLFSSWLDLVPQEENGEAARKDAARRAIAAGEVVFNTAPVQITNVRGLNDNPALGKPASFVGHCTSCHDTPGVGNHSLPLPLDIGTSHTSASGMESDSAIAAAVGQLSTPDLPVYLISGCQNPFAPGEPESFYTSDPGKALVTGLCSDFNRGKGPVLRGLAARAPYFHNGSAANLHELVDFYNLRFDMQLTEEQKSDLVAFLNAL